MRAAAPAAAAALVILSLVCAGVRGEDVAFTTATLAVALSKDGSSKTTAQASYPAAASGVLKATQEHDVSVTFKLSGSAKAASLDQVMAVLEGAHSDYAVSARASGDGSEFVAQFPLAKAWDSLVSGQYDVVLYVSDDSLKEAKKWAVGSVTIELDVKPKGMPPPIFQYNLLHDSDVATSLMPEIHHQFRAPDRRAPNIVAFAFTGGVCVIFAVYALSVLVISGNGLARAVTSPSSLLFALNLAALLGLYVWYWLGKAANGPTMNELWVFALPVALALVFTARNAVSHHLVRGVDSLKSE